MHVCVYVYICIYTYTIANIAASFIVRTSSDFPSTAAGEAMTISKAVDRTWFCEGLCYPSLDLGLGFEASVMIRSALHPKFSNLRSLGVRVSSCKTSLEIRD